MMVVMARVLISESHVEVHRLLERIVTDLDHEPVAATGMPQASADLQCADLLIVEPADPKGGLLAKTAQTLAPGLPVVCVSVLDESQVDFAFCAFLSKPFTSEELADVIERALAHNPSGQTAI
jgi:DNA-binding NtrC family response regulator